jgi:hypothetical protein
VSLRVSCLEPGGASGRELNRVAHGAVVLCVNQGSIGEPMNETYVREMLRDRAASPTPL